MTKKVQFYNSKQIIREAEQYFKYNPAYTKLSDNNIYTTTPLSQCVEKGGSERVPVFGYPIIEYDEEKQNAGLDKIVLDGKS